MRRAVRLIGCMALLTASLQAASAAPPSSCASKFIGTWVYPGGTTVVAPGGTAYPKCPMCVPTQSWTCQGNTYLFSNSGPPGQFSATLSADGRQLIGSGTVATRVGGARVAASPPPSKPEPARQEPHEPQQKPAKQPARTGARQQANCSDITGTKSGGQLNVNCKPSGGKVAVARPAAPQPQPVAQQAAPRPAPASTGGVPSAEQEAALAGDIVDQLGRVRSGQIPSQPMSGASSGTTPPPPDPAFDPKVADPYRPPETLPVDGQPCVSYFQNMRENFRRRAALCLRDTVLLESLTDAATGGSVGTAPAGAANSPYGARTVTRNTAPELFAHFDPLDPRWTISGDSATPNCDLPMTVASQRESFMECARVYMCGMRAASCGLQRARQTRTNQCVPISRQCLAENPVPQQMTADPAPPAYQPPPPGPPLPNPPHRESTITGPSGPGGGGTGGGVMSAQ